MGLPHGNTLLFDQLLDTFFESFDESLSHPEASIESGNLNQYCRS
jgi:hypothetical protein